MNNAVSLRETKWKRTDDLLVNLCRKTSGSWYNCCLAHVMNTDIHARICTRSHRAWSCITAGLVPKCLFPLLWGNSICHSLCVLQLYVPTLATPQKQQVIKMCKDRKSRGDGLHAGSFRGRSHQPDPRSTPSWGPFQITLAALHYQRCEYRIAWS